jgi:hypothetical protein
MLNKSNSNDVMNILVCNLGLSTISFILSARSRNKYYPFPTRCAFALFADLLLRYTLTSGHLQIWSINLDCWYHTCLLKLCETLHNSLRNSKFVFLAT